MGWQMLSSTDEALTSLPEGKAPPDADRWVHAIITELDSPDPFVQSDAALELTWDLVAQDFDARIRQGNDLWLPVATGVSDHAPQCLASR